MHRKRLNLITAFFSLAVLVAGLAWLIYAPIRQERLNHALIAAIKRNDTKAALTLLAEGADSNARNEPPQQISFWRLLLDRLQGTHPAPSTAPTALLVALEENAVHEQWAYAPDHPRLIQALLDKGANPNVYLYPYPYKTALFDAVTAWTYADDGRRGDTIKLLLDHGADPNPPSLESPLIIAIRHPGPKDDVLLALLNHGAKIDAKDYDGDTALMEAVQIRNAHVTRLLLSYHANPTIHDKYGRTPLSCAKELASNRGRLFKLFDAGRRSTIIQMLRQAGAKK